MLISFLKTDLVLEATIYVKDAVKFYEENLYECVHEKGNFIGVITPKEFYAKKKQLLGL